MRRKYTLGESLLCAVIVISLVACTHNSSRYENKVTADGMELTLSAPEDPLPKGDSQFILSIKDKSGNVVKPDRVEARFFMKNNVPGLGPQDLMLPALPKDEGYVIEAALPADGEWFVEISLMRRTARPPVTVVTFTLNVR